MSAIHVKVSAEKGAAFTAEQRQALTLCGMYLANLLQQARGEHSEGNRNLMMQVRQNGSVEIAVRSAHGGNDPDVHECSTLHDNLCALMLTFGKAAPEKPMHILWEPNYSGKLRAGHVKFHSVIGVAKTVNALARSEKAEAPVSHAAIELLKQQQNRQDLTSIKRLC